MKALVKLGLKRSRKADELYTVSITKEIATYLYNESAQDYPGEDYERVAVHGLMALSFHWYCRAGWSYYRGSQAQQ